MRDPFLKARLAHKQAQGGALGQADYGMPGAPGAPGKSPGPMAPMGGGQTPFAPLAKRFGVDKLKLNKNPVVARTQLLQHLSQKLGPDYMKHPGVSDLLNAFGQHHAKQEIEHADQQASSSMQRNIKALMG